MISSVGPVPLVVVWVLVAMGVAMLVARVLRVPPEEGSPTPRGVLFDMLLVGLLAGRLGFILRYWADYRHDGWAVLRLGDGGFLAWVALLVGLGWGAWRLRRWPRLRAPVAAGALAGVLCWAALSLGSGWLQRDRIALPTLALTALDGTPATLGGERAQPTVVNLWATWCGPCRREMPVLARAQQRHPELRFVFANQGETADDVQAFLKAEQLSLHNVLLDEPMQAATALHVQAYPTTLFFDRDGRLRDVHLGELSAAGLESKLARLR
ncbi:TlpA family protein disulfide reductase [Stenotrophomonas sp. LGBM10]|uniref:TlpA family protein disulfide reductase n=1 Tax=Stenotrophomonas sp. LGBM10 TaxID=3390038 RepID=UPI00398B6035